MPDARTGPDETSAAGRRARSWTQPPAERGVAALLGVPEHGVANLRSARAGRLRRRHSGARAPVPRRSAWWLPHDRAGRGGPRDEADGGLPGGAAGAGRLCDASSGPGRRAGAFGQDRAEGRWPRSRSVPPSWPRPKRSGRHRSARNGWPRSATRCRCSGTCPSSGSRDPVHQHHPGSDTDCRGSMAAAGGRSPAGRPDAGPPGSRAAGP